MLKLWWRTIFLLTSAAPLFQARGERVKIDQTLAEQGTKLASLLEHRINAYKTTVDPNEDPYKAWSPNDSVMAVPMTPEAVFLAWKLPPNSKRDDKFIVFYKFLGYSHYEEPFDDLEKLDVKANITSERFHALSQEVQTLHNITCINDPCEYNVHGLEHNSNYVFWVGMKNEKTGKVFNITNIPMSVRTKQDSMALRIEPYGRNSDGEPYLGHIFLEKHCGHWILNYSEAAFSYLPEQRDALLIAISVKMDRFSRPYRWHQVSLGPYADGYVFVDDIIARDNQSEFKARLYHVRTINGVQAFGKFGRNEPGVFDHSVASYMRIRPHDYRPYECFEPENRICQNIFKAHKKYSAAHFHYGIEDAVPEYHGLSRNYSACISLGKILSDAGAGRNHHYITFFVLLLILGSIVYIAYDHNVHGEQSLFTRQILQRIKKPSMVQKVQYARLISSYI
uniref:Fibronectin type-III domain-containing protein n=1 Tax=Bursaphelenchus xylophilus TaxID=6326 RepID=A0A1I7RX85_BURXY